MRRIATACLVAALTITAAAQDPEELLRQGLFEEEGNQNLEKAKENYLQLAELYDQQRRYAATALFRLGEIARKEGHAEEAAKWYRRVVSEFPENEGLARLSRQNLAGLGMEADVAAEDVAASDEVDEEAVELARLKELKKSSPDLIDGTDEAGWRPIHFAAARNWTQVMQFLLEEGADVNGRSVQPAWTPLHVAVAHGHLEIVRMLLEAGAALEAEVDLSQFSGPSWREMPLAPISGGVLLGNWRPLHLAALWRRIEVAKALLAAGCERDDAGAEVYLSGRRPVTPMMVALVNKHREMATVLLAAGADPNVSTDDPDWSVATVAMQHAPELLPMLLESGADPNHLHFAVKYHPESVPILIEAGAGVNRVNEHGLAPLHYASDPGTANMLLDAGAELEARTPAGATPLLDAAREGNAELVEFLLERGADLKAKRFDGRGVLEEARNWAVPVVYEHLIYPGASRADAIVLFNHYDADGQARPQSRRALPPGEGRAEIAALRLEEGFRPPGLVELLLINQVLGAHSLRILRPDEGGRLGEFFVLSQPEPDNRRPDFPALRWGDVVEILPNVNDGSGATGPANVRLWWNTLPAREITLKAGPWKQRIRIAPAVLPASASRMNTPWETLGLRHLANSRGFAIDPRATISVGRGDSTARIGDEDHNDKRIPFVLQDGDVIEFGVRDGIMKGTAERWKGVRIFNAGTMEAIPAWGRTAANRDRTAESRHLLHLLGLSVQGENQAAFLAGADLSSVIVQRPGPEGMKEIRVDVVALARELAAGGEVDASFTVAERDVPLKDGDLVVLFPRGEVVTLGQDPPPLDPAVEAFLRAAAEERERKGAEEK